MKKQRKVRQRLNITLKKPEPEIITPSLERQQWLEQAVEALRTKFAEAGYTIPQKIGLSIGWPKRAASCGAIGECWSTEASSDKRAELFISPELTDNVRIIGVLTHELDHATVGTEAGHGKLFKRCALRGRLTRPNASNYGKLRICCMGRDAV